ncbi:DUF935 domain-containing protein [Methylopila sp. 73B]|uniref:DUF935 domain-containing protein n=1 Tax=Methylopila sp. 73B TaxID=1120792 RepID=UPI00055AD3AC|nr:DUF935 domain-containing protein [Methylopila sp. 73B]
MSGLVDARGNPIASQQLSEEIATPTLAGVRRTIEDSVAAGLTPERLSQILVEAANGHARSYLTLAEEMEERYQHYASQLQTRRLAIEGISVSIDAPKGVPAKIVDFVTELVETPRFEEATAALTDGIAKGFCAVEMMWEYEHRALRPVEYKYRDQRFFQFDRLSLAELRLATDTNLDGVELPPAKFIRHMPRSKMGIPLRRGLARPAGFGFLVQQFGIQSWAAFAEIYGVPFRLGKYHSSASDGDKRMLLQAVRMIAQDAAAICPAGMEIEFHKVEGQHGSQVFGGLIDYIDKNISKLVVGQTMTADDGASMAQAKVHNEVRIDILRADCKQLAQTLNRDVIEVAVAMNFGPQVAYPQVALHVAEPEDVKALTDSVSRLVPLGFKVSQREMREKLGLSEPQAEEELLTPPAAKPAVPPGGDGQPAVTPPAVPPAAKPETLGARLAAHVSGCRCDGCLAPAQLAARPAAADDGPAEVEALMDRVLERDWEPIEDDLIGRLRTIMDSAASLEEAKAMLEAKGPDARRLTESLARATAIARGIGDVRD